MTKDEEQSANLIVGRITVELDQARCEIDRLRAALRPLANAAKLIDSRSSVGSKFRRPDSATIWQARAYDRSDDDLTMGHARAARKALEGE